MPSPPKASKALTSAIKLAATLTVHERHQLLQACVELGVASPVEAVLLDALKAATGSSFVGTAGTAVYSAFTALILVGETEGLGGADKRKEVAIMTQVIHAAQKRALEEGGSRGLLRALQILTTTSWRDLLNDAFPGYGANLLGDVLCHRILIGNTSFGSCALTTAPPAPTSAVAKSTSNAHGAARKTPPST